MAGHLVRKLRGHDKGVLCCVAAQTSTHLLVSSSEDGTACLFDIRCKSSCQRLQSFGGDAVVSVYLHPGNEDKLYAAAGKSVYVWDLRLGSSATEVHKYSFNKDEINQLAVNRRATFLAAADDTGEIKIVNLSDHKLYKTLRRAHTNVFICPSPILLLNKLESSRHPRGWNRSGQLRSGSSDHGNLLRAFVGMLPVRYAAQFSSIRNDLGKLPVSPTALSGALDCRIVKWDFSRGRSLKEINLGGLTSEGASQICNPPFIHSLAVAEVEHTGEAGRIIVAARGDGAVDVFDLEFKNSLPFEASSSKESGTLSGTTGSLLADDGHGISSSEPPGRVCHLGLSNGGHRGAVSTVTFARFGCPVQYIVSGGNDSCIKLWEWANQKQQGDGPTNETNNPLTLDIQHRKKINWCTTTGGTSENLVVADTSKVLSVYSIL